MPKAQPNTPKRTLDARPDTLDFRDRMYLPALIEVPTHIPLTDYRQFNNPILDQGQEGACTGFGLAAVANYLLTRRRVVPDPTPVSPRMLYELARRYDEWPGENYSGSSARGAMKAWHKHGVCAEQVWPYRLPRGEKHALNEARTADAVRRPLGAYFRVNHKDIVAMHSAIAEVGILYATGMVTTGWDRMDAEGVIPYDTDIRGGHAFAIVAYDARGFWIQNSWGPRWGLQGFACITYDDWLEHGTDVWVARLGAPVTLRKSESAASAHSASAGQSAAYSFADLRPHIVSVGNDGKLKPGGDYGTSTGEVRQMFEQDIPRATAGWAKKRILLYAHGGLVGEKSAVQRLADYRPALLQAQVYPVSVVWYSDFWTTITNILQDAVRRRRPEGRLDQALDFMLDRLDDALEPLVRVLLGKLLWDEMKENALGASRRSGGARLVLDHLAELAKGDDSVEIHVAGHSAGSIFLAPLVRLLTARGKIDSGFLRGDTGYGLKIASATLWAPGCTIELFKDAYLPAIQSKALERFALFVLSEKAEQDDSCAGIYHKSLLWLVSNALEAQPHIPGFREGVPLLGLERHVNADRELNGLFRRKAAQLIVAPNDEPEGSPLASRATHHGDFDDDQPTVRATLAHILGAATAEAEAPASALEFHRSDSSMRDRRLEIDRTTQVQARA